MPTLKALVVALFLSTGPACAGDLAGTWRELGGEAAVRIAPCRDDVATLCVVLVEPQRRGGERIAVSGLRAAGENRWRGRYVLDGQPLAASITLTASDQADMTACRWALCKTVRYGRSAP